MSPPSSGRTSEPSKLVSCMVLKKEMICSSESSDFLFIPAVRRSVALQGAETASRWLPVEFFSLAPY
jgi:hypothetical protein